MKRWNRNWRIGSPRGRYTASLLLAAAMAVVLLPARAWCVSDDQALQQKIDQRAAAIGPRDALGHEQLARFLYQHQLYDQALQQINEALQITPKFQDAMLLKDMIETAQRQQVAAAATPASVTTRSPEHLLTSKDIEAIRLWELTLGELANPGGVPFQASISAPKKTLARFWRRVILVNPAYRNRTFTQDDLNRFLRVSNYRRQIYLLLTFGDAYYWNKIHIKSDPLVMRTYRTDIQPAILQSCATRGCHRGQNFHGFKLFGATGGAPNWRQTYTNFYIITHYTYQGRGLIDYANPRLSLLLQYTVPPPGAVYTHPGKKGPLLHSFDNVRIIQWIDSLRYPPHQYHFNYQWPQPAASQPVGP